MPSLLTTNVWQEISKAAAASVKPAHVAVAYFGYAGPKLLPLRKGSSLVVDASIATVSKGSTSPTALEEVRKKGVGVYSAQYLHAKVFAFDEIGFVGSANASDYSANQLIEAVLRVDKLGDIDDIRAFVNSIALTRLSAADLKELSTYYKKPQKFPKPVPKQGLYSTLLMELTDEQHSDYPGAATERCLAHVFPAPLAHAR